jgi:protein TonB
MHELNQTYQKRVKIAFGGAVLLHILLVGLVWRWGPLLFGKREVAVRLLPYTEVMDLDLTPPEIEAAGRVMLPPETLTETPPEPLSKVIPVPDWIEADTLMAEMPVAEPAQEMAGASTALQAGGAGGLGEAGRGAGATGDIPPAGGEGPAYDERPRVLKRVEPEYPRLAKMAGVEGMVVLSMVVDETGKLEDVQVIKSLGNAGCDEAAVKAVRQWVFAPATRQGKPIAARVTLPILFNLKTAR